MLSANKQVLHDNSAVRGIVSFAEFESLYTSLDIAIKALNSNHATFDSSKSTFNDSNLALEFNEPRVVLFRQIATPTYEILHFLKIASAVGIKPLILEHYSDKFVVKNNKYKKALGKMPIHLGKSRTGTPIIQYRTICDFSKFEGKRLCDVFCTDNTLLADYHHQTFAVTTGIDINEYTYDASVEFAKFLDSPHDRYLHLYNLLHNRGLLFENYLTLPSEVPFIEHVVKPAFQKATVENNQKPLIVKLLPEGEEFNDIWDWYPKFVLNK